MAAPSTTMDELVVATSAAVGQVVGVFIVFPLDVVKTRIQVQKVADQEELEVGKSHSKSHNTSGRRHVAIPEGPFAALRRMIREEGVLKVWARFPAKGVQQGLTRFTYYWIYTWVINRFRDAVGRSHKLGFWANLMLGYLAGLLNTVFLSPLETLATRVMVSREPITMLDAARDVLHHHGVRGFYFGQPTATMFISANPAVQNTVFDQIRAALLGDRKALGFAEAFLVGVLAKSVATVTTYPASRATSIIQNTPTVGRARAGCRSPSVPGEIAAVYREGGIRALYSGLQTTLLKGVLQAGVMLMVKERVDYATRLALAMV